MTYTIEDLKKYLCVSRKPGYGEFFNWHCCDMKKLAAMIRDVEATNPGSVKAWLHSEATESAINDRWNPGNLDWFQGFAAGVLE